MKFCTDFCTTYYCYGTSIRGKDTLNCKPTIEKSLSSLPHDRPPPASSHSQKQAVLHIIAIYGPMFYTASYVIKRVSFRAQKSQDFQAQPPPTCQVMDFPASQALHTGPYQSEVYR